ncbi:MAG: glycosyl hydrolase family 28 protein [Opitutales bacterium]
MQSFYHLSRDSEDFPLGALDDSDLEILDISHNRIGSIPEAVGALRRLRIFNGIGNAITELPDALGGLPCLEELRCLWTPLRFFPGGLSGHPSLRELNLRGTAISRIPAEMEPPPELRILDLRNVPGVDDLPAWVGRCPQLRELRLSHNGISSLPTPERGGWEELEALDLANLPLERLPDKVATLKHLKRLTLTACALPTLPDLPEAFPALTELTLDGTHLEQLPGWLRSHSGIEWFSAKDTPAIDWRQECRLPRARVIRLSGCRLETVPEWIRESRALRTLVVERNRLLALPAWLAELPELRHIYVDGNPIDRLPEALAGKPGLRVRGLARPKTDAAKTTHRTGWAEALREPAPPQIPETRELLTLDSSRDNGRAINAAIAERSRAGGGIVELPPGDWPTGPIELRDRINLHLSEGCRLLFNDRPEDYLPACPVWWDSLPCWNYRPLIYAHGARDIAITGKGTLDGNHEAWLDWKYREERASQELYRAHAMGIPVEQRVFASRESALRPQMVHLLDCERVLLCDYTARRSPFWNHHLALCRDVTARRIVLQNPSRTPNTDGFNLDACLTCRIEDLDIDVGDDALCLKAGMNEDAWDLPHGCEGVQIRRCRIRHGHGGIVFGSATGAGIREVLAEHCEMIGTERGIRMKSMRGRGGGISDVLIRDCQMKAITGEAIEISSFYGSSTAGNVTEAPPVFERIRLEKITCEDSDIPISVRGLPEAPIDGLRLRNLKLRGKRPPRFENVGSMTFDKAFIYHEQDAPRT